VTVIKGDIRDLPALMAIEQVEFIIDCAAEPSALAGRKEHHRGAHEVVNINLGGTVHCLELAKRDNAAVVFISTNRIYPIEQINSLPFIETETRIDLPKSFSARGVSYGGVSEDLPLMGKRTLYGATKLASELIIEEYADMFGVRAVVNRCAVMAGPWQFGASDQGLLGLWLARHVFGGPLSYIGFGGKGAQVRDLVHIEDITEAVLYQLGHMEKCQGNIFNLGGGRQNALSLNELTALCQKVTGIKKELGSEPLMRPGDIKWYVTDYSKFNTLSDWRPKHSLEKIVTDTYQWMEEHKEELASVFGPAG
jgi:CDP-paratose 2-epimerase